MTSAAFLFSDKLANFDYGDDHPFKPIRARNTKEQCTRYGLLYGPGLIRPEPDPVEPSTLESFHRQNYLKALKEVSSGRFDLPMLERGLGTEECPALPGVFEFSLLSTGATMLGVELVMGGQVGRAFNLVGGFHHAYPDHAEGFCYLNDAGVALAAQAAQGRRVAFIDIDAHHCNGIQHAFYEDDRVLVISLHESGKTLYPWSGFETELGTGRGTGFNVNIPMLENSDDEVYLSAFRQLVPPLIEAFAPDLVIAEIGADTMISDPLTHLRLTNNGYFKLVKEICAFSPHLVALGGGGYDVFRTTRCWTLAWAAMSEQEPEDTYAGAVGGMMFGGEMGGLWDPQIRTAGPAKERAMAQVERLVSFHHEHSFPVLGARKA